jgi:hypothetical protein
MIARNTRRPGRSLLAIPLLLAIACAGCKPRDDRPPAPETAAPAPPAAVTPAEDRGRKQGDVPAPTPESDQSAFSHVDSGEAERAASQRGHDSAGEPPPAAQSQGDE